MHAAKEVQQGTIGTSKGFTGQYNDWLTGLDYYNARYYDPVIGQFLSADTVQGNAQGMDPYSYVGGNPETMADPTGERFTSGDDPTTSETGRTEPDGTIYTQSPGQQPKAIGHTRPQTQTQTQTYHAPPARPKPHPAAKHSASQVVKALSNVAGIAGKLLWEAVDLVFNFSGMWHDVQTLTDPNANWWDRLRAIGDLGLTVFTDLNMLDGEGEAARAAEVGEEVVTKGEAGIADMAASCGTGLSFVASTQVASAGGKQAIGTLKVGDKIWAYNPQTKQMELQPILHVWLNHDNDLVDLTITKTAQSKGSKPTSEVIHTNQKHPFLTVEMGFLPVGKMKVGMHVLEADGQVGVVSGWKVVPGAMTMYNLEVAQDHTFTVGAGEWVVHNSSCTVKELDPLHSPTTSGRRPQLENLSDQELLDSVNHPKNGDPIRINTNTGKVMDGNGRAYELLKRAASPGSKITPDTPVYYEPYTPTPIREPWE